jgi:hypothetical protein
LLSNPAFYGAAIHGVLMRRRLLAAALATAVWAAPAGAQTREMTLTGAGSVVFKKVYVGKYSGASPGLPALDLFCVDFLNSMQIGDTWTARFTSLSHLVAGIGSDNTRFGQQGLTDIALRYQKAAWLSMQFALNSTSTWGGIHQAIWNIFTPTSPNWTGTGSTTWRAKADLASTDGTFDSVDWQSWYVVTDVNTVGGSDGKQEFLTYLTPEPETLILLATGLAVVLGYGVASRRFV